jgi:hypothetical protein
VPLQRVRGREHSFGGLRGNRFGEQEALAGGAAEINQPGKLVFGLNALRNHGHVQ